MCRAQAVFSNIPSDTQAGGSPRAMLIGFGLAAAAGPSERFRAAQGGAEWSRRQERGGRCAYEGLGMCVAVTLSQLLPPDTSALGQIQGVPRYWLAGLPPLPRCSGQPSRQALLTGSLITGGAAVPYKYMTLWNLAGASQTLEVALALDQRQPVAGEVERRGKSRTGGQP